MFNEDFVGHHIDSCLQLTFLMNIHDIDTNIVIYT